MNNRINRNRLPLANTEVYQNLSMLISLLIINWYPCEFSINIYINNIKEKI